MRRTLARLLLLVAPLVNACAQPPSDGARSKQPFSAVMFDGGDQLDSRDTVPVAVCDPTDQRWCRLDHLDLTPNAPACAPFWEQVPGVLSCSRVPQGRGGEWTLGQSPTCLVARLGWGSWGMDHLEECFYDAQTGKLVAARGKDACAIYHCNGISSGDVPEMRWGVDLASSGLECGWSVQTTLDMECLPDGSQRVRPVLPPSNGSDGGSLDVARRSPDVWSPPPPVDRLDAGVSPDAPPPPPPTFLRR